MQLVTENWTQARCAAEAKKCRKSFVHWLRWVWIEEKSTGKAVQLDPYNCQVLMADWLQARRWVRILKARRLGVTWLCAAYAVWLVTFFEMKTVAYLIHKRHLSHHFIDYCRFILKRLPDWMKPEITGDAMGSLTFDADDAGCWIRSFAATKGAADSIAADFVILDEAPMIEATKEGLLQEILRSVGPTVETSNGFIVQIGTSIGPTGHFYTSWMASERDPDSDKFSNTFWSWREHPKRDDDWYEKERKENGADPLYMPREYPETVEEAFTIATGRIYPTFRRTRHVLRFGPDCGRFKDGDSDLPDAPTIPDDWPRWRGVDWGGRDPFVCLWMVQVPNIGVGLSVDPSCQHLIREMMAYRYKPSSGWIEDRDNHGPDALRYVIVTCNLHGHIHVYRELYVPDHVEMDLAEPQLADMVADLSRGESIQMTVCDRSRPSGILILRQHLERRSGQMERVVGNTKPHGESSRTRQEVEEGIARVNTLIIGTRDIFAPRDRDALLMEYEQSVLQDPIPMGVGTTLDEMLRRRSLRKRLDDRQRKSKRIARYLTQRTRRFRL